jgi:hypothetical protein
MCDNTDSWIHPLFDLGYEAKLVEQQIELSKVGGTVKPDVVVQSKGLNHSIPFDCKGGITAKKSQLERYVKLTKEDLKRYLDIFDLSQFTHDVCYFDLAENHEILAESVKGFPFLTLSPQELTKSGKFSKRELERAFENRISRNGLVEPTSYYPFSEMDTQGVIVKHIITEMIAILQDKRKRSLDVLARATYANHDVMKSIHKMYDLMRRDQRETLSSRVFDVVTHLQRTYGDFTNQLLEIQSRQRQGEDAHIAISNLGVRAQEIIDKEEQQSDLDQYWKEPS